MLDRATKLDWLALIPGEAYMKTLAPNRHIFILHESDGWCVAWHQWSDDGGAKPRSSKTLVSRVDFTEALQRAESYVEWWFDPKRGKQTNKRK